MQSHGVLTCACDCVAKNACLPLLGEIKPPQTTQNCRDNGKSSAAISGTDLTLRVGYFPRQPRTPVLPRRPPDSWSTSYPAVTTCWHIDGDGVMDDDGDGDGATDDDDDDEDDCNDCDGAAARRRQTMTSMTTTTTTTSTTSTISTTTTCHRALERGMIVATRQSPRRRGWSQILWRYTQQSNRSRGGGVVDGDE